jgi:hypothetical protein
MTSSGVTPRRACAFDSRPASERDARTARCSAPRWSRRRSPRRGSFAIVLESPSASTYRRGTWSLRDSPPTDAGGRPRTVRASFCLSVHSTRGDPRVRGSRTAGASPRGGVFRHRCGARHVSRLAPSGAKSLAAWPMTRLHRFGILRTMLALSYVSTDPGVVRAAGRSADRGKREPAARAFSDPAVTGWLCSSTLRQGGAAPVAQAARLGHVRGPRAERGARPWAT